MLAALSSVEQGADPAWVLDRRGRDAVLAREGRREVTVAREAELQRERAQVAIVPGSRSSAALRRSACLYPASVNPVSARKTRARWNGEVWSSVRARRATAARRGRRRSRTWPPPPARGGRRSSACGRGLAEPVGCERRQHEPDASSSASSSSQSGRAAGERAGAGAGTCACRPGRASHGDGRPGQLLERFLRQLDEHRLVAQLVVRARAGTAGRRCRASCGLPSPARARGPAAESARSAAGRRGARDRRSGSSRATTRLQAGSGTHPPRASASRAAGSRWPHPL